MSIASQAAALAAAGLAQMEGERGVSCTLLRRTATAYDPETGASHTTSSRSVTALISRPDDRRGKGRGGGHEEGAPQARVRRATLSLATLGGVVPTTADSLVIDGDDWRVVAVHSGDSAYVLELVLT